MQKVTETESNFTLASLNFHLWWVLILLACLYNPNTCLGHNHQHNNQYAALFIFGDSLFDPGNNNYINTTNNFRANFWPYGESFFRYPTGRSSDGRLIPDFIAEYAKLPLIPPYLQPGHYTFAYGANFASAGAGVLVESFSGMVVDLKTQLSYFKKVEKQLKQQLGDQEAKQLLSNAVYLFCIGNNDYLSPFLSNSSTFYHSFSQKEYIKMVIGNFTDVINDVYKSGGRKFGILSVLPLGCIPSIRALKPGNNCMAEVTDLAKLHNKALFENLKNLEKHLKGFMYSYFDIYTATSDRMDNPLKYGFKEGKIACCGTGPYRGVLSCGGKREVKEFELCDNATQYLFFDSTHPSEIANHQLAHLMWGGGGAGGGGGRGLLPNVTGPYNLKSLFEITLEPSIEEP